MGPDLAVQIKDTVRAALVLRFSPRRALLEAANLGPSPCGQLSLPANWGLNELAWGPIQYWSERCREQMSGVPFLG